MKNSSSPTQIFTRFCCTLGPLRFAVDYDGVVADTNNMKREWIKEGQGLEVPAWRCDHTSCVPEILTEKQYQEMAEIVYGKDWSFKARPVPGAITGLFDLARIGAVYIVTARLPERLQWVREWLRRHALETVISRLISTEYPSRRSKKDICVENEFHLLIDDDRKWVDDFADLEIPVILFKYRLPQSEQRNVRVSLRTGTECLNSWRKVVNLVRKMGKRRCARLGNHTN